MRAVVPTRETLAKATEDVTWARIAGFHAAESKLDNSSLALIRVKSAGSPSALDAGRLAVTKAVVENPLMRAVRTFERSMAEDTVRNEYLFHSTIHDWLANDTAPRDLKQLNEKVYAELFLTPESDPWLGLAPRNQFSALENGGLVEQRP